MKEPPLKNFWEKCNGVEILQTEKDRWAEECINFLKDSPYSYVRSGNSIVFAFIDDEEQIIEILDCTVNRTARIKNG